MQVGQTFKCVYCLEDDGMIVRLDKRNRPYMVCLACGARTFLRGRMSLRGPSLLWGPLTLALDAGDTAAAKHILAEAKADPNVKLEVIHEPAAATA